GSPQFGIQLLTGHAGLDNDIEVLRIHFKNAVHAAEIDGYAAARRIDLSLQRRTGSERDHRHLMGGASRNDRFHVVDGFGEDDAIGKLRRQVGGGMSMLLAERLPSLEPSAECPFEKTENRCDPLLVPETR